MSNSPEQTDSYEVTVRHHSNGALVFDVDDRAMERLGVEPGETVQFSFAPNDTALTLSLWPAIESNYHNQSTVVSSGIRPLAKLLDALGVREMLSRVADSDRDVAVATLVFEGGDEIAHIRFNPDIVGSASAHLKPTPQDDSLSTVRVTPIWGENREHRKDTVHQYQLAVPKIVVEAWGGVDPDADRLVGRLQVVTDSAGDTHPALVYEQVGKSTAPDNSNSRSFSPIYAKRPPKSNSNETEYGEKVDNYEMRETGSYKIYPRIQALLATGIGFDADPTNDDPVEAQLLRGDDGRFALVDADRALVWDTETTPETTQSEHGVNAEGDLDTAAL